MRPKRKLIAGTTIVTVAGLIIGLKLLTAPGAPAGMPEHITITEAVGEKAGQLVKVGGDVVPGSINWDNTAGLLSFTLTADGDSLLVQYPKPAPNDFKPGIPLVVDGTYSESGVFVATSLTSQSSPLCKTCHQ